jgi:hypothetical protein
VARTMASRNSRTRRSRHDHRAPCVHELDPRDRDRRTPYETVMSKYLKRRSRHARARRRGHILLRGRAGAGGWFGFPAAGGYCQVPAASRRRLALFAAVYLLHDPVRRAWEGVLSLARARPWRDRARTLAPHRGQVVYPRWAGLGRPEPPTGMLASRLAPDGVARLKTIPVLDPDPRRKRPPSPTAVPGEATDYERAVRRAD